MVSNQVRDLLIMGVRDVKILNVGQWWEVSSEKDWLISDEGTVSLDEFYRIIKFPLAGMLAVRNEVVIASLSRALVTAGSDGVNWIVGDPMHHVLPNMMSDHIKDIDSGRTLIFLESSPDSGS